MIERKRKFSRYCRSAAGVAFGIAVASCAALASSANDVEEDIRVTTIELNPADPEHTAVGRLEWRGGISITHADSRFGGLSGLEVSQDGETMTAVTDRGYWVNGRLRYRDGHLTGLDSVQIKPIPDTNGRSVRGGRSDAESVASDGEGGFYVSFERSHRVAHYPNTAGGPLAAAPKILPIPDSFNRQPSNGGIETLARLCDGRLLAISEQMPVGPDAPDTRAAWIYDGKAWRSLAYAITGRFEPTGAATLPDCSIAILERSFSLLGGLRARIVQIAAETIEPETLLSGEEIAQITPPLSVDNMEGLAARSGPDGETLIYMVSDDNFSVWQRTLLMMFALRPGTTPAAEKINLRSDPGSARSTIR